MKTLLIIILVSIAVCCLSKYLFVLDGVDKF